MKKFHLTVIVVAGALSLASANAMPDLGRETGKFLRKQPSAPHGVKTFVPTKSTNSKPDLSCGFPFHPPLAVALPLHPPLAVALPLHPPLAVALPFRPPLASGLPFSYGRSLGLNS
jgi:hypothetical protein